MLKRRQYMPRVYKLYLDDILKCIKKIEKYTKGISYEKFIKNALLIDAIIRNLEVIGEATKKIPHETKKHHNEVEWKKIAGLRDILIHEYFGVNLKIIWDVVVNKIPEFKKSIQKIKRQSK